MSLSETMMKPTTMLYRNFLTMETEELIRSQPIDGVVPLGGCDKSAGRAADGRDLGGHSGDALPASMLRGNWRGEVLGSGSVSWKYRDDKRDGLIAPPRKVVTSRPAHRQRRAIQMTVGLVKQGRPSLRRFQMALSSHIA